MTEPDVQPQVFDPLAALQAPVSYDDVVAELQNEIGSLTVQLRVARLQNQKNVTMWHTDKQQLEAQNLALSTRLAALEGTPVPTLAEVDANVPDEDTLPQAGDKP